ncbi:hypothetical protein CRP01_34840 [Flavilitoribacter nigricans DSM 23189 = NBRC 102662]|uniref:Uncharacterized protein n=2 Tax=Flavilitoribacter TaxID=2762562 RepID=A0A2D0N100_FLAN2|nr:hypothetical protein CRP01_34840 [Flavilitoribacter nigricans DSM 23189 = NBRC 102662]
MSRQTAIPKSSVHYHLHRENQRHQFPESVFWDSEAGQNFLKRLITSAIYTFGVKGGVGAGRIEEFMRKLRIQTHVGISESSIYRQMKAIELSILKYKELRELDLADQATNQLEHLEVVLGLDETWLDTMLLVCQELSSGYLFLKSQKINEIQKAGGINSRKA